MKPVISYKNDTFYLDNSPISAEAAIEKFNAVSCDWTTAAYQKISKIVLGQK